MSKCKSAFLLFILINFSFSNILSMPKSNKIVKVLLKTSKIVVPVLGIVSTIFLFKYLKNKSQKAECERLMKIAEFHCGTASMLDEYLERPKLNLQD